MPSAYAGTKEELMRLQKDVQDLRKQLRELDENFDKNFNQRIDGLKSLIAQLNDQVATSNVLLGKMSSSISSLEKSQENQNAAVVAANDKTLQEIRKLSGKIDEKIGDMNTRISALAQQLNEMKVQSKPITPDSASEGSLSPEAMYDLAYRDFVRGNYDLAIQEFTAYINKYPGGEKAASALLHTGSAYLAQNKLPESIRSFSRIIYDYPSSESIPGAFYKRAQAELAMQERQNAVDDLRNIVDKYPSAPEAEMAKAKLKELGVVEPKPAITTPRKKPTK